MACVEKLTDTLIPKREIFIPRLAIFVPRLGMIIASLGMSQLIILRKLRHYPSRAKTLYLGVCDNVLSVLGVECWVHFLLHHTQHNT